MGHDRMEQGKAVSRTGHETDVQKAEQGDVMPSESARASRKTSGTREARKHPVVFEASRARVEIGDAGDDAGNEDDRHLVFWRTLLFASFAVQSACRAAEAAKQGKRPLQVINIIGAIAWGANVVLGVARLHGHR